MPGSPTEGPGGGHLTVAVADYLWFADRALSQMVDIVETLGDDLANRRPPFAGANSAFVILTHCLGVMEYWAGGTVAERPYRRDRPAEFTASGDVATLVRQAEEARGRLHDDLSSFDPGETPANVLHDPDDPVPYTEAKGAVPLHIMEELYQHLGQMELTRDVLLADPA